MVRIGKRHFLRNLLTSALPIARKPRKSHNLVVGATRRYHYNSVNYLCFLNASSEQLCILVSCVRMHRGARARDLPPEGSHRRGS